MPRPVLEVHERPESELTQELDRLARLNDPRLAPNLSLSTQRYMIKLQAIHQLLQGALRLQVLRMHGISERTLRRWINQWNERGLDGLKPRQYSGRGYKLGEEAVIQLQTDLTQPPTSFGYVEDVWHTKLVLVHLATKYQVRYHPTAIYRFLRRLGLGLRTPYPEDPRQDEAEVQAFQETILPAVFKKKRFWSKTDIKL